MEKRMKRNYTSKLSKIGAATLFASVLIQGPVEGATVIWNNSSANGLWNTDANWTGGPGVVTGDTAVFNNTAVGSSTMNETSPFTLVGLTYTNTLTANTLALSGNTLVVSGTLDVAPSITGGVMAAASVTNVTISGGTLRPTNLRVTYSNAGNSTSDARDAALTVTGTFDSQNLANLAVAHSQSGNRGQTRRGLLDLSGATLVSGSTVNKLQMSNLDLGYDVGATGQILLPSTLTNLTITGTARIGNVAAHTSTDPFNRDPLITNHDWVMPTGATLQVGTISTPGNLRIGYHGANRTNSGGSSTPNVTSTLKWAGPGGSFVPFLADLDIGRNDVTNNASDLGTGTLDLSQTPISGGTLRVTNLRLGFIPNINGANNANNSGARGTFLLSATTGLNSLRVDDDLIIGGAEGVSRIGDAGGILPSNVNVQLGVSSAQRGKARIGYRPFNSKDGMSLGNADGMLQTRTGTFQAHLTSLSVGVNDRTDVSGAQRGATGLLDLRNSTFTATGLDVSGGAVNIGRTAITTIDTPSGGSGRVYLPAGNAIANTLNLGSTNTAMTGLLDMTGTTFVVQTSVNNSVTGRIDARIQGSSAGLDITNSASAGLAINSGALISLTRGLDITFTQNPADLQTSVSNAGSATGVFWGLRWKGNHTGDLTALLGSDGINGTLNGDVLRWNQTGLTGAFSNAVNIFYDAGLGTVGRPLDMTYIGFYTVIPEPASVTLLVLGGLPLLLSRRRRA